jgi:hypothetical protein
MYFTRQAVGLMGTQQKEKESITKAVLHKLHPNVSI